MFQLVPEDYKRLERLARSDEPLAKRTFGDLKRKADGTFNDDDLAKILHDATESHAGVFRAYGSPECLGFVDKMGILKAREWK